MSNTTTTPVVRQRAYKMLAKKAGIDAFTGKAIGKGETIFYIPKGMYDKSFAVTTESEFGLEIQTGPTWTIIDHTTTPVPAVPVLTTAAPRPAPATPSAAIAAALNLAAAQTAPAPAAPAPVATTPAPVKRNHGSGFRLNGVEDLIKILPLLQSGGVTLVAHPRKPNI